MLWPLLLVAALLVTVGASENTLPVQKPEPAPPSTPREFFNAGTEKLREGKLREAEAFLQSVLGAQVESLAPPALYNLGHVRYRQGIDELKKGPSSRGSLARGNSAAQSADTAINEADDALNGTDIQKMISAYMRGRGARRDLKEAGKAVRQAVESFGSALSKWQRASGDFRSAVELNARDSEARQNADTVDRSIAKLIDTLRQMQQMAAAMGQKKEELGEKMKQLKGKIPADQMPPGAAGDDEEEDDPNMGSKPGEKENPGREGDQQMTLSPEQAGWLLEGFKLDSERRLPMGQTDTAEPKLRSRKTW